MAAEIAYIYAMGTEDGPTKIGYAMVPEKRLKAIQREDGKSIKVTGKWPIGRRVALNAERYVHWQLRDRHIRGEWFNATREEIVAAVESAIARQDQFDPYAVIPSVDPGNRHVGNTEHIVTKFPKGTKARIEAVLGGADGRAEFIREAVARELARRERDA